MAFGKKNDADGQADGTDYLRIPPGTKISGDGDFKLQMSFNGDMSLGESLPQFGELECGRNMWIDRGVTIKANAVRVKASLELEEGAELETEELEVENLVSKKARLKARTVSAGEVRCEGSEVVADRITAREGVSLDRGDMEIGTVMAQTLNVAKGTNANILIREVARLDGDIPKGGYEGFEEFLGKVFQYHPEILNEQFQGEARRILGHKAPAPKAEAKPKSKSSPAAAAAEAPAAQSPPPVADEAKRLPALGERLRAVCSGKELPAEVAKLAEHLSAGRAEDARRDLSPTFQKLSADGKMPPPVMEVFREVQEALRKPKNG